MLRKKLWVLPTGVEPMTFQVPVGCSNQWAMGRGLWVSEAIQLEDEGKSLELLLSAAFTLTAVAFK